MVQIDSPAPSRSIASGPPSFYGLGREALARVLARAGEPAYRADQLMTWVYRRRARDPRAMSNLPLAFRARLPELFGLDLPAIHGQLDTASGDTCKFVLRLRDVARAECVSIRTDRCLTMCLSS